MMNLTNMNNWYNVYSLSEKIVTDELNPQKLKNKIIGGDLEESYFIQYVKAIDQGTMLNSSNIDDFISNDDYKMVGFDIKAAMTKYYNELYLDEYKLDLVRAHKHINFIEKELKHFEAPFAGKPFILTLEQKAIAELLFGYLYYDPEYNKWVRRFTEMLLVMARKNGKSPFIAALALSEWICGEMGTKILCASNNYEQAALIYDTIEYFREESATLVKVTHKNQTGIYFGGKSQIKKKGKFSKQNKGSIKKFSAKTSTKEGRNLKVITVDEEHEMEDATSILPLKTSLSTQEEPLFLEISSDGMIYDGYLDHRKDLARKVLRGEDNRNRWLILLYTQDSLDEIWTNEISWLKSNPLLGVCKKISQLREYCDEARNSKSSRAFLLAKEFNYKYSRFNAWLDDATILKNNVDFTLEDFRNHWCIAGVDLAESNDLAAVTLLFLKQGNYDFKFLHTMYFVPESKAKNPAVRENKNNLEGKDYISWEEDGYCIIVKGNIIDDNVVANYLWELFKKYNIRPFRVGYDIWEARELKKQVAKNFGEQVPLKISMNTTSLNIPTKTLEDDLNDGLISYQNNPICIWNFRNTTIYTDSKGLIMPVKNANLISNKIDGTMSKVIAYATLRQVKQQFIQRVG